jgi:hypothetical protein
VEHAAQGGDCVAAPLGRSESCPGVRQKRLASGSRRDQALVTMKEPLPELPFEASDLRADRRLRHGDAGRAPCELPLLGHRHEVGELPQVHNEFF